MWKSVHGSCAKSGADGEFVYQEHGFGGGADGHGGVSDSAGHGGVVGRRRSPGRGWERVCAEWQLGWWLLDGMSGVLVVEVVVKEVRWVLLHWQAVEASGRSW